MCVWCDELHACVCTRVLALAKTLSQRVDIRARLTARSILMTDTGNAQFMKRKEQTLAKLSQLFSKRYERCVAMRCVWGGVGVGCGCAQCSKCRRREEGGRKQGKKEGGKVDGSTKNLFPYVGITHVMLVGRKSLDRMFSVLSRVFVFCA